MTFKSEPCILRENKGGAKHMNIQTINEALEWRGIELLIDREMTDDALIPVQIRFSYPESTKSEKWKQLQIALSEQFDEVFHIFILEDTPMGLNGLLFNQGWLTDRSEKWVVLERYLNFMLYPMEEETRPNDALANSYPVIQKEQKLVDGAKEAAEKSYMMRELEKSLLFKQFVISPKDSLQTMEELFQMDAFDDMMTYCIKHLPQYTGSLLESIGEDLWKEWQTTTQMVSI